MGLWTLLWYPNFIAEARTTYNVLRDARASRNAYNRAILEPSDDEKSRLLDMGEGTIQEWNTPLHSVRLSGARSSDDDPYRIRIFIQTSKIQPDTPPASGFTGFNSMWNEYVYSSCQWVRVESFEDTGADRSGFVRAIKDVRFVERDGEAKSRIKLCCSIPL